MILLKMRGGSHLYGLTTPNSDLDYLGVYIEDTFEEFINPFNTKDELDLSVVSKLDTGKNSTDAIDEKYFHIKKFIKLCSDCNPNILEMLWAPDSVIEYVNPHFKEYILNHPEMFLSKKLINRFIGYAKSQEQKSYTKSENYIILDNLKRGLERSMEIFPLGEFNMHSPVRDLFGCPKRLERIIAFDNVDIKEIIINHSETNIETIYEIGDMTFPSGLSVKDAVKQIGERFKRASHRVESILINKYEPKFMSHTIRLLDEGCQLLSNGRIDFPFTGDIKSIIMMIKTGEVDVNNISSIVNAYKDKLSKLESTTTLPENADYDKIASGYHMLIMNIYPDTFSGIV